MSDTNETIQYIVQEIKCKDPDTGEVLGNMCFRTPAEVVIMPDGTPITDKVKEIETGSGSSSSTYTNETPVPSSIGGIKAGETFDAITYNDLFTRLLYPYVNPSIKLASTIAAGYIEKGTEISPTLTATATKNTSPITKVEICKGSDVLKVVTDGYIVTVTDTISDNTAYTARVTDDHEKVAVSILNYTFVYPLYYGSFDGASLTADAVKLLTKNVTGKGNKSVEFTTNSSKMVFACPPGWEVSNIIDPNGFNITSSFTSQIINFGTADAPVNYTVYVSNVTTQSKFKVTFNV